MDEKDQLKVKDMLQGIEDEIKTMDTVGKIVKKNLRNIVELLKSQDDIEDIIKETDKKMKEINEEIDAIPSSSGYIEIAKQNINKMTEETKRMMVIGFLFGATQGTENFFKKTSAMAIFLSVLEKQPFEEIYALGKAKSIKGSKENIIRYFQEVIPRKYQTTRKDFSLSDEFLQEGQQAAREKFPKLGNNKFRWITSDKTKQDIAKYFPTQGITEVTKTMIGIIEKDTNDSAKIENTVSALTKRIDIIFDDKRQKTYERFAKKYILRELEAANKRKEPEQVKKPKETPSNRENDITKELHQEEAIIKKEDLFLDEICKDIPNKEGVIKYIQRLHRNGKEIRIADLKERFIMPKKEIFTEEIIAQAKTLGINITENGIKENGTKSEKGANQEIGKPTIIATKEKSEKEKILEKIREYIDELEVFNAENCIKALTMAKYKMSDRAGFSKSFTKSFNALYPSPDAKRQIAEELKIGIFETPNGINQKNKKEYQTIDLKSMNRILFLEKGVVDGIYNHNDYMRRLNNQK